LKGDAPTIELIGIVLKKVINTTCPHGYFETRNHQFGYHDRMLQAILASTSAFVVQVEGAHLTMILEGPIPSAFRCL